MQRARHTDMIPKIDKIIESQSHSSESSPLLTKTEEIEVEDRFTKEKRALDEFIRLV